MRNNNNGVYIIYKTIYIIYNVSEHHYYYYYNYYYYYYTNAVFYSHCMKDEKENEETSSYIYIPGAVRSRVGAGRGELGARRVGSSPRLCSRHTGALYCAPRTR